MAGPTGKRAFALLQSDRHAIDTAYGPGLHWDDMPGRKQARISETLPGIDLWNEADWPRQHQWLADRLDRMHRIFQDRVRNLDLAPVTGGDP
jgi:hypothetical protein